MCPVYGWLTASVLRSLLHEPRGGSAPATRRDSTFSVQCGSHTVFLKAHSPSNAEVTLRLVHVFQSYTAHFDRTSYHSVEELRGKRRQYKKTHARALCAVQIEVMSSAAHVCCMQEWVAAISAACLRLQGVDHSAFDASAAGTGRTARLNSGAGASSTSADAGRAERFEVASAGAELTERLREETARLQRSLDSMKMTLRSDAGQSQDGDDTIPAFWGVDTSHSGPARRQSQSAKSLQRAAALLATGDGPPSDARTAGRAWRIQVLLLIDAVPILASVCWRMSEHSGFDLGMLWLGFGP